MHQSYITFECLSCHKTRKLSLVQMKRGDATKCPHCGKEHNSVIVGSYTRPSNIALST